MTDTIDTTSAPSVEAPDSPDDAGARRLGRPADVRRGREHRADRRPPSSRRCRPRPCSSSTTARPTAPASSPTHLAAADPPRPRPPSRARSRVSAAPISTGSASRSRAARRRSSRWTPTSATTRRRCRDLVAPIADGAADLVIGSRYTKGGVGRGLGARPAGRLARREPVRADRPRARPERPDRRLQGVAGDDAGGRPVRRRPRRRLRLPDRDDVPASRAGARIREVPITFRDRRVGQSKMSRRIVVEALVVVVQLRAEEIARAPARRRRGS